MKKGCVVNYSSAEEKEELAAYLKSKGFRGEIRDFGSRYGVIVNFEKKMFSDGGITVMACACSSFGQPVPAEEFIKYYESL